MDYFDYVIIGGGYAGDTAAATLRKAGAQGRILLVSGEREYPYRRYLLSKDFLLGKRPRERMFLHPHGFYEERNIELKLAARAEHLGLAQKRVTLDNGEEVSYGRLLLAPGASLRRLSLPGVDLPGVFYLRSLADAEALRQQMLPGRVVVVIGAAS